MGGNTSCEHLVEALQGLEALRSRGFTATCGPTGGVVVDRWNHVHGVWHFHQGNYFWTPAGYNEPTFRTSTMDKAIEHTLSIVTAAK